MLPKIRYRLVYNYANRLNGQGLSTVAVECRQGQKKVYFSSNVTLYPNQWCKGMVVNHSKAEKLTAYLVKWRNEIEEIELNALLKGLILGITNAFPSRSDLNDTSLVGVYNINLYHLHIPSGLEYGGMLALKVINNSIQIVFEWIPSFKIFWRVYGF